MVMQARKYPRLNDGYYERGQAHSGEEAMVSKGPRRGPHHNDYYRENNHDSPSSSFSRHRDDAGRNNSPRYQNKSYKDKGNSTEHHGGASTEHHSGASTGRSREQRDREHKAEVQKTAVRMSGDWSEHNSSSGKRYYYNCKTELSQWERPKDWKEPASCAVHKERHSNKASKGDDRSQHSSLSSRSSVTDRHSRPVTNSSHHKPVRSEVRGGGEGRASRDVLTSPASSNGLCKHPAEAVVDAAKNCHDPQESITGSLPDTQESNQSQDMDISPGSTPTEESLREKTSAPLASSLTPSSSLPTASTPTLTSPSTPASRSSSSRPLSTAMLSNLLTLPVLSQLGGREALKKLQSQQITQQAIQTLQQIQQALLAEQQQQQLQLLLQQLQSQVKQRQQKTPSKRSHASTATPQEDGGSPVSPDSDGTPLQSPEYEDTATHPRLLPPSDTDASPLSDHSRPSRRDSRSPSVTSSHSGLQPLATSQLASAHRPKTTGASLTPSLANYVCDKLTQHVTPWVSDPAEMQANRLSEEGHTIGAIGCAQVSCELKQARSLVRITEIEATLQEQRILFLNQQVKDLDNLRVQSPFVVTSGSQRLSAASLSTPRPPDPSS